MKTGYTLLCKHALKLVFVPLSAIMLVRASRLPGFRLLRNVRANLTRLFLMRLLCFAQMCSVLIRQMHLACGAGAHYRDALIHSEEP